MSTKITTEINGKAITITLTKEQIAEINIQQNQVTVDNITYESALKLLNDSNIDPNPKGLYAGKLLELVTIIKAVNFLDNNNQEWAPNFNNLNKHKYYNWFEKTNKGWVFDRVCYRFSGSCLMAGGFFKKESSAKIIAARFLGLYSYIL